ncbi:MAG: DUF1707 domain-containing protein [Nocardioides sp.]
MTDEAMWGRFARDPREPENRELLASDADREVVAQALADAFADGRLDPAEFDRRSTAVVGSKTLGDLLDSLSDLLPTKIERRPTAIVQPRRNLLPAVFGTAFFVMFIATFVVVLFGFFVIFMQF